MTAKYAYLAGLIDGEGYIGMVKTITRPKEAPSLYVLVPRIQVKMCNKEGIEMAHKYFGGSIYFKKLSGNNRDQWVWQLTGHQRIKNTLTLLLPYLVIKKYQAEVILEFLKRKRGDKYTDDDWNLYGTLRALNKTGRN